MNNQKKVLVVEDDQPLNYYISDVLKKHGHNVAVAFDGEEAVNIAKSEDIALILLDVLLPKMTGWEVLRVVKQDENMKNVPVVVMSNLDSPAREYDMETEGADEYVVKVNMTKNQLIELVNKYLTDSKAN